MQKAALDKLSQIQTLLKQREEIEKKLESLLVQEKKQATRPPTFSLNEAVLGILKQNIDGVLSDTVFQVLQEQFPAYGISKKDVNLALTYLTNKRRIVERAGRGFYRLITIPDSN